MAGTSAYHSHLHNSMMLMRLWAVMTAAAPADRDADTIDGRLCCSADHSGVATQVVGGALDAVAWQHDLLIGRLVQVVAAALRLTVIQWGFATSLQTGYTGHSSQPSNSQCALYTVGTPAEPCMWPVNALQACAQPGLTPDPS